jgi:hypothetical protein
LAPRTVFLGRAHDGGQPGLDIPLVFAGLEVVEPEVLVRRLSS